MGLLLGGTLGSLLGFAQQLDLPANLYPVSVALQPQPEQVFNVKTRMLVGAVTGMRRASNRIPKRSLDTDFELSQVSPIAKSRPGARRGPSGPCKSRKAAFTSTGAIIPQGTS